MRARARSGWSASAPPNLLSRYVDIFDCVTRRTPTGVIPADLGGVTPAIYVGNESATPARRSRKGRSVGACDSKSSGRRQIYRRCQPAVARLPARRHAAERSRRRPLSPTMLVELSYPATPSGTGHPLLPFRRFRRRRGIASAKCRPFSGRPRGTHWPFHIRRRARRAIRADRLRAVTRTAEFLGLLGVRTGRVRVRTVSCTVRTAERACAQCRSWGLACACTLIGGAQDQLWWGG